MGAGHVLWATGSSVDGWAGRVVWERAKDAISWAVGVGSTLVACGLGCVSVLSVLGDGCGASRRSIHLFLSIVGEGTSLAAGGETSLADDVAWAELVVGDWTLI